MVRGDNAMHHGKPHAGAFANPFRGIEGIKDALQNVGCHTMSSIPHREVGMKTWLQVRMVGNQGVIHLGGRKTHLQDAPGVPHGMRRIRTKVHHELVDLRGPGPCPRTCVLSTSQPG